MNDDAFAWTDLPSSFAGDVKPERTPWLNISAGVWKPRVFLGLLFNAEPPLKI